MTPARMQWAGLLITAIGAGVLFAVGVGLIVFGVGVLAFGIAAEREVVTDGSSSPAART